MLTVKRWGRGDPVVCLHAIGHGAADFEPFAERVGDSFEVIAVEWPGLEAGPVTAERYADLLEREWPCKSPAVVIGNSIGGAAAIILAARRPDLVRGLVLCNAGGLAPVGPFERRAIAALTGFFRAGARRAWWFKSVFAAYYRMVLPRAPQRRREIVDSAYEIAPLLAQAWAGFARPEADLRPLAKTIQAPTLFAWAKGDRIIPWARSRAAAEQFPHHGVRLFRGGHSAFLEDADAFAEAFREGVAQFDARKAA